MNNLCVECGSTCFSPIGTVPPLLSFDALFLPTTLFAYLSLAEGGGADSYSDDEIYDHCCCERLFQLFAHPDLVTPACRLRPVTPLRVPECVAHWPRFYGSAHAVSQEEVEQEILDVLLCFDRIDSSKVSMLRFSHASVARSTPRHKLVPT